MQTVNFIRKSILFSYDCYTSYDHWSRCSLSAYSLTSSSK